MSDTELEELLTPLFVQARSEALREANNIRMTGGIVTNTPSKVLHLVKEVQLKLSKPTNQTEAKPVDGKMRRIIDEAVAASATDDLSTDWDAIVEDAAKEATTHLQAVVEQAGAKKYLDHFYYGDWEAGNDSKLRVGDYILCNFQDHNGEDVSNIKGRIVLHDSNYLPVVLYNIEDGNEDDSGDYADLQGLFMNGYDFTRLQQLKQEESDE